MSRAGVCILGWYGSPNIGDEAELAAILAQLATLPQPPPATVFSTDPTTTLRRFRNYPGGLHVLRRSPLSPRTWAALRRCGLLIFGGGGLIQDQTSIYNLPIFTAFAALARLMGTPIMWWGVGVEPLVTAFGRWQARQIVAWCVPGAASIRDEESLHILTDAGVPAAQLRLSIDPALTLPPANDAALAELSAALAPGDAPIICCLRDLPNNPKGRGLPYLLPMALQKRLRLGGGYPEEHRQSVAAFYAAIAAAADNLIEQQNARILFLPFWAGRDDEVAREVVAIMRYPEATQSISHYVEPRLARALIGSARLVVSVRLHPLVFATAAGVPALGFGYARKIGGFLSRVGASQYALDPLTVDAATLQAAIDALLATDPRARQTAVDELTQLAHGDLEMCAKILGLN